MAVRVFHRDQPDLMMPIISADARLIVWPGVGAEVANMNYVVLEPDEQNVPHTHEESEDTIYILEGRGTIKDFTNDFSLPFEAGDAVHVPAGVKHAVCADLGSRIVSVGGPCPPDRNLLRALGVG